MNHHDAAWLADEIAHLAGHDEQRISALAWCLYGRGYTDGHTAVADDLTNATRAFIAYAAGRDDEDDLSALWHDHPLIEGLTAQLMAHVLHHERLQRGLRRLAERPAHLELTILRREDFLPALAQHQRIWDGWAPGKTA